MNLSRPMLLTALGGALALTGCSGGSPAQTATTVTVQAPGTGASGSATPSPSDSATSSPSDSATPSASDSATPSASDSASPGPSDSASPSVSDPASPSDPATPQPSETLPSETAAPAGGTLRVGQPATVLFESGSTEVSLRVTPTSVKRGTLADFEGYRLDATAKASTPFYVTVTYRHLGKAPLRYPFLNVKLNAQDANGDEAQKLIVSGLAACKGDEKPSTFKTGDETTECSAFLVPKGGRVATISYRGNFDEKPVRWSAAGVTS